MGRIKVSERVNVKSYAVRLSPENEKKLRKLFAFYGVKSETLSDAMREFIVETYAKLMLYKNSLQASDAESEQKLNMTEILCNLRISCEKAPSC